MILSRNSRTVQQSPGMVQTLEVDWTPLADFLNAGGRVVVEFPPAHEQPEDFGDLYGLEDDGSHGSCGGDY